MSPFLIKIEKETKMAINVNSNFHLGSKTFLDSRESVGTLDDLLALDTNIIPNGFECYVEALDCKYKYHKNYKLLFHHQRYSYEQIFQQLYLICDCLMCSFVLIC